jgi:hypothetical protein
MPADAACRAVSIYDVAETIFAAWRLGAGDVPIPVSLRPLEYAVAECRHLLPDAQQGYLSFSGGRCVETPEIILAAETVMAIQTNGTDFLTARFAGGEPNARRMVAEAGMTTASAVALGQALKAAVDRRRNQA